MKQSESGTEGFVEGSVITINNSANSQNEYITISELKEREAKTLQQFLLFPRTVCQDRYSTTTKE